MDQRKQSSYMPDYKLGFNRPSDIGAGKHIFHVYIYELFFQPFSASPYARTRILLICRPYFGRFRRDHSSV